MIIIHKIKWIKITKSERGQNVEYSYIPENKSVILETEVFLRLQKQTPIKQCFMT